MLLNYKHVTDKRGRFVDIEPVLKYVTAQVPRYPETQEELNILNKHKYFRNGIAKFNKIMKNVQASSLDSLLTAKRKLNKIPKLPKDKGQNKGNLMINLVHESLQQSIDTMIKVKLGKKAKEIL